MSGETAKIFNFPVFEKTLDVLREAIWQLDPGELLTATGSLVSLAMDASERGDDTDFYDRTKAAYLALERVLIEGARI